MPTDEREGLRERLADLRGYIKAGDPLPAHALRTVEDAMDEVLILRRLATAPAPAPEPDAYRIECCERAGAAVHDGCENLASLRCIHCGATVENGRLSVVPLYRATPPVQPRPDASDHCWHRTGSARMSLPPQYEERCCECGLTRWAKEPSPDLRGHGPYAPVQPQPDTGEREEPASYMRELANAIRESAPTPPEERSEP